MINNELKFSTTSSSKTCKSLSVNTDGTTCVTETSEHVEIKSQVREEESVVEEHGGSISQRYSLLLYSTIIKL